MKGKIFVSVLCGVIAGVLTLVAGLIFWPAHALLISLLVLSVAALLLHTFMSIIEHRMNKLYAELEKNITSPIFFKTNGNFDLGDGVLNGNIYFCDAGIVFASVDQKPYLMQHVSADNIFRYEFEDIYMHLYTKDGKQYDITLADIPEVRAALQGKYGL